MIAAMKRDPFDWAPVFGAFRDALEWVLDVAAHVARNYPDEVAAVERVRVFIRRRIAGKLAQVRTEDLMLVIVLVAAGLERDLAPRAPRGPRGPWFGQLAVPAAPRALA